MWYQDPTELHLQGANLRLMAMLDLVAAHIHRQMHSCENSETIESLREAFDDIGVARDLQSVLADAPKRGVQAYLDQSTRLWARLGAPRNVRIQTEIDQDCQVLGRRAAHLAVVVHEAVADCFAHAYPDGRPGTILVRFSKASRSWGKLVVADDGTSRDTAEANDTPPRHVLMQQLCIGLSGTVEWTDTPLGGSVVTVLFPLDAAPAPIEKEKDVLS